jgi:hypothetical protein
MNIIKIKIIKSIKKCIDIKYGLKHAKTCSFHMKQNVEI